MLNLSFYDSSASLQLFGYFLVAIWAYVGLGLLPLDSLKLLHLLGHVHLAVLASGGLWLTVCYPSVCLFSFLSVGANVHLGLHLDSFWIVLPI